MAAFKDIRILLSNHLQEISNLPSVVWENTEYTPQENELYLATFFQPNSSENRSLGANAPTYETGNYQINVYGIRGAGWADVYDWVDSIIEKFKRGTVLTDSAVDINVRVQKAFPRIGFFNNEGRFVTPIDIRYICFMPI